MKLVIYVPNWVGDAVMTLPALYALDQVGFDLKLFGRPWLKDLFAACPWEIHSLEGSKKGFSKIFKSYRGEYGISFRSSFSSAWAMYWGGIKTFGYHADIRWFLLHHGFPKSKHIEHRVITTWRLAELSAEFLGVKKFLGPLLKNYLPVSQAQEDAANAALIAQGISKPYWVLCPFATGGSPSGECKIWPHWQAFCMELQKRGITTIICPSPSEEKNLDVFTGTVILKNIPLGTYNAILKNAAQVVANDTGPMHMAAAVGAPTLGIFGVSNPRLTYPWGGEYIGGPETGWPTLKELLGKLCTVLSAKH